MVIHVSILLPFSAVSGVIKRTDTDQGIADVRIYIVYPDSLQKHKGTSDSSGNFAVAVPHGSKNDFLASLNIFLVFLRGIKIILIKFVVVFKTTTC